MECYIEERFFVQAFFRGVKGHLIPGDLCRAEDRGAAIRQASRLASSAAGAVALAVKGDHADDLLFDAAVVLAVGDTPADLLERTIV